MQKISLESKSKFLASLTGEFEDDLFYEGFLQETFWDAKEFSLLCDNNNYIPATKLIDELGKLYFESCQITAKKVNDSYNGLILLSNHEKKCVESFIKSDYEKLDEIRDAISEDVRGVDDYFSISCLTKFLELKKYYTFECTFQRQKIQFIILYDNENAAKKYGSLAQAFLHGIVRFCFKTGEQATTEYKLIKNTDLRDVATKMEEPTRYPEKISKPTWDALSAECNYVPFSAQENSFVPVVVALADIMRKEFYNYINIENESFSILFMCKLNDGWVWLFSKKEQDILCDKLNIKDIELYNILSRFRLKTGGMINHFSNKELLVDILGDFKREKFLCSNVGYYRDNESKDLVNRFIKLENIIVEKAGNDAQFCFFRLTSHAPESKSKVLPNGSIVVVTPIAYKDRKKCKNLINIWRKQIPILSSIEMPMQILIRTVAVRSAIAAIMSRNGSHNIGSHVLAALSHRPGVMPDDRVLYKYIQHRMDYIATVTTDFPSWTKPTWFVGDLMKDFFMQRHLLNFIADSEGLSAYYFQDPNLSTQERNAQKNKIKIFVRRIQKDIHKNGSSVHTEWADAYNAKDNSFHFVDYTNYKDDKRINFEHDIQVAIPGGAIGRHAFYTILENIIRNASKHGWSKTRTDEDNLNIYIDLKHNPEEDFTEFMIWDNMSNIFIGDDFNLNNHEAYISELTEEELKSSTPGRKHNGKILQPLHHMQQINLTKSLISESGELRKEHWGLAEMKISAGYLQKKTVAEIGGLENVVEPIITPVAMPAVCCHKDNNNNGIRCYGKNKCKECKIGHKHHLGYRFKIPNQKEILIVLYENQLPKGKDIQNEYRKHGIYLVQEEAVREYGYEYIVLPFIDSKTDISKYPFRLLAGEVEGNNVKAAQLNLKEITGFKRTPNDIKVHTDKIKKEVYRSWLNYLKKSSCNIGKGENIHLSLSVNDNSSSSGKGLINDEDIFKMVLRNLPITLKYLMGEDEYNKRTDVVSIQQEIAKFNYDLDLFCWWKMITQLKEDGYHEDDIKMCECFNSLKQLKDGESGFDDDQKEDVEGYYKEKISSISSWSAESDTRKKVVEILKLLNIAYDEKLVSDVLLIYRLTHHLFSNYEESIVTLPCGYSLYNKASDDKVKNNQIIDANEYKEIGINISTEHSHIMYERHCDTTVQVSHLFKNKERFYVEGLSGTQSYLNELESLTEKTNISLICKLVENAVFRVLIIDERMVNFLIDRHDMIKLFSAMQMWVGNYLKYDGIELLIKKEYAAESVDAHNLNFEDKTTAERPQTTNHFLSVEFNEKLSDKFDILIIHQGILDKFLKDKKMKSVEKFIAEVKKYIPYVVITTGRGKPDNIPDSAKILPFSTIENALFRRYPEKLLLIDTIMNILPIGEKHHGQ